MSDAAAARPGTGGFHHPGASLLRRFAGCRTDRRFGDDPLDLARGRILLPNNRAVRTITEAFVRASGSGLVLPRLVPIGDPELDERHRRRARSRRYAPIRSRPRLTRWRASWRSPALVAGDGASSGGGHAPCRRPRANPRRAADRGDRASPARRSGSRCPGAGAPLAAVARPAARDPRSLAGGPRARRARSTLPSGATSCCGRWRERWAALAAGRLYRRGRYHHRCAGRCRAPCGGWRTCPKAWSCCRR